MYLLDLYLSKFPLYAFQEDVLFLRPKKKACSDAAWYDKTPIGKNTLAQMVKNMCCDAEIEQPKTNHSLRATGATSLFQNHVPERVIQKVTGHRSFDALRCYERISVEQHSDVSNVIMSCVRDEGTVAKEASEVHCARDFSSIGTITDCSIGEIQITVQNKSEN